MADGKEFIPLGSDGLLLRADEVDTFFNNLMI